MTELEAKHLEFAGTSREVITQRVQVDHGRTGVGERLERCLDRIRDHSGCGDVRIESVQPLSSDAHHRALQTVRVHELRVIRGYVRRPGLALPAKWHAAGRRIASIKGAALNNAQRRRRICNCASVRTNGVLGMRDGNNACAAGEPNSWFNRCDTVCIPRANDAAIGLAAKGNCREVRRSSSGRSGTRTAGVAIDAIRIVGLPASSRPPADGFK